MHRTCASCGSVNRVPVDRLHETGKCGRCKSALTPASAPIEITDLRAFDDIVAAAQVPVLVDFWAEWCGPCRMVAPEVARVASQLSGRAIVLKVNTEQLPQLAQRYRVSGIPNFALFEHGRMVRQQAGAMRATELAQFATSGRPAARSTVTRV
jgi:thioredoxin 2